jgi:hypothetical protein
MFSVFSIANFPINIQLLQNVKSSIFSCGWLLNIIGERRVEFPTPQNRRIY